LKKRGLDFKNKVEKVLDTKIKNKTEIIDFWMQATISYAKEHLLS